MIKIIILVRYTYCFLFEYKTRENKEWRMEKLEERDFHFDMRELSEKAFMIMTYTYIHM